jgi:hypothetical protein
MEKASDQNGTCIEVEFTSSMSSRKKIPIKEVVINQFFIEMKLETLPFTTTVAAPPRAFPRRTIVAPTIYEGHCNRLATFHHQSILGAFSRWLPTLKKTGHCCMPYSDHPCCPKTP